MMPSRITKALFILLFSGILVSCIRTTKTKEVPPDSSQKPRLPKELRGIWLRPPADPEQAPAILDNIRNAGFNLIFLETLYHGFAIYPGSNFPLRPEYRGKDVLNLFLREAHKRGIAVHCWTEVFYWQVDTEKYPQLPHSPVLDRHPEWLLLTKDGKKSDVSENAHIFADPSNPSVQAFLLEFYRDLSTRYDIDGINLDYIRFSAGSHDTGYTDFARTAFKNQTGVDPIILAEKRDQNLWMEWVEWREDRVTELVGRIAETVKREKPGIMLSAAIFSRYYKERGKNVIYQDWETWLKRGYLDAVIPMAYGTTLDAIEEEIRSVSLRNKSSALLNPALAISIKTEDAYGSARHPSIDDQIKLVRSLNLKGHSIFCYSWILKNSRGFDAFSDVYKTSKD